MTPAVDLAGTFVFALSGAVAGVRRELDLFGVVVVALAAGIAGGILRDVLLDQSPPIALGDWRFVAACVLASVVVLVWHRGLGRAAGVVVVFDAAGLALFAVTGTLRALTLSVEPVGAIVVGVLTGIGGGIARDLLVGEIPFVLQRDVYALAALAGSVTMAVGYELALPLGLVAPSAAIICFVTRVIAWRRGWNLQRVRAD
ncbi:MAG TPA: trimeric intracellular cation channel family protein [Candidatus Limnocylindria bacterium]